MRGGNAMSSDAAPVEPKPDGESQAKPEVKVEAVAAPRPTGSGRVVPRSRKIGGDQNVTQRLSGPVIKPPDKMKSIALLSCLVLFIACIGVGWYRWPVLMAKWQQISGGSPAAPVKTKLTDSAQVVVDKAEKADALYKRAKELAKNEVVADLQNAADNMEEAAKLWSEIVPLHVTVPGYETKIEQADRMMPVIDGEIRELRKRAGELDIATQAHAAAPVPAPVAPAVTPEVKAEEPKTEAVPAPAQTAPEAVAPAPPPPAEAPKAEVAPAAAPAQPAPPPETKPAE